MLQFTVIVLLLGSIYCQTLATTWQHLLGSFFLVALGGWGFGGLWFSFDHWEKKIQVWKLSVDMINNACDKKVSLLSLSYTSDEVICYPPKNSGKPGRKTDCTKLFYCLYFSYLYRRVHSLPTAVSGLKHADVNYLPPTTILISSPVQRALSLEWSTLLKSFASSKLVVFNNHREMVFRTMFWPSLAGVITSHGIYTLYKYIHF